MITHVKVVELARAILIEQGYWSLYNGIFCFISQFTLKIHFEVIAIISQPVFLAQNTKIWAHVSLETFVIKLKKTRNYLILNF